MSTKLNKKALALALASVLVVPSAHAFNVFTGDGVYPAATIDDLPEEIAEQNVGDFAMSEDIQIIVELGDAIIGRTTGFQVKVTLVGAEFGAVDPALVLGDAMTGGWTAVLAAGGQPGTTIAQFSIEPTAPGSAVVDGTLGTITNLDLSDAPGDVKAAFQVVDPVTGTGLHLDNASTGSPAAQGVWLVDRVDGLAFTCDAQANPDQIDVGTNVAYPTAKTGFVGFDDDYDIGEADASTAPLGEINVAATAGFMLDVGAGGDTLTSRINGSFAGFDAVFLATDDTCGTTIATYTINATESQATLDEEFADLIAAGGAFGPAGGSATVCVTVDGTTPLTAQQFDSDNVFLGINGDLETDACNLAPLEYNGSVVKVYHVNPARNNTAQSFVRVINPSNTTGMVTVVGYDDAGNPEAAPIRFNLPAGQSMQFNSDDLEDGNAAKFLSGAFGDGTGKWRLEITGEFDGMVVQGLNRNSIDGTVTNLTDADNSTEQRQEEKLQF